MGKIFDMGGNGLTKPALIDSNGPTYYNSDQDALSAGSAKLAADRPTVTVTPPSDAQLVPGATPDAAPQMVGAGGSVTLNAPSAPLPMFRKPTFQQASTDANGMPIATTPGLTKAGKLLQVLSLAAKSAMAGQAANEQAVIASGGHRSGGAGIGFEAGLTEPVREAMEHAEVQRSGLANQTAQMALDQARTPVTVNGSTMPFWMAQRNAALSKTIADTNKDRFTTPRNGGVYDTVTGQYAPGTEPQDKKQNQSPQQLLADAVADAQRRGVDPATDPKVKQIQDVIAATNSKPDTATEVKQKYQAVIGKLNRAGELPQGSMKDIDKVTKAINSSKVLTQDEKDAATGYLAANTTPASTATDQTLRAQIFVNGRAVPMEDPATGATYYTSAGEAKQLGTNAYAKGTNFNKNAIQPMARLDDVDRAITAVNKSVPALDSGNAQRGLIYQALQDPQAHEMGAVNAFLHSKAYTQMDPKSRDYVVGVLSLREQIMAANQLLTGSAGTSDSRVQAIWNTLPNGTEPDSDMARRKMDQVKGMMGNLREAFPLIQKVKQAQGHSGSPSGGTRPPLSNFEIRK